MTRPLFFNAFCLTGAVFGIVLLHAGRVSAQSSCEIAFEAYVTDVDEVPVDGPVDVELSFYVEDTPEAEPLDCRFFSDVVLDDGWLRVILDECTLVEDSVSGCGSMALDEMLAAAQDAGSALLVGVFIEGDTDELSPRLPVTAVPFALVASQAEELVGVDVADLEESDEIVSAIETHASAPNAHHGDIVTIVEDAGFVTGPHTSSLPFLAITGEPAVRVS